MLPAANRLKKERDFERVFKKGEKTRGRFFLLKFADNNLSQTRFGIAVSKKVSSRATERNKIKRKIREAIGQNLSSVKQGFDVVLLAFPPLRPEEVCGDLIKDILKKADLLSE